MNGRPPMIVVALAVALAITALWWQLAERRARMEVSRRVAAEERLGAIGDSLRAHGHGATGARGAEVEHAAAVIADLERHPELIPYAALEGGTMRFYPAQCRVITPGWAYGYFEDGHIAGEGLFEYSTGRDGRYRWKRIAARLE